MLTKKATTNIIVCGTLFILSLVIILFIIIKDKIINNRFWYKHTILYKVTQDKKIIKFLSERLDGQDCYMHDLEIKGKSYRTFIYDSFISNNKIWEDDRKGNHDKKNAERKVLIIFPEMLRQYDPKVLKKQGFDDVIRIVYPRDPKNLEDLNEQNCRAILKLLDLGYSPENISIYGICLGAEFAIGALNCHHLKLELNNRKFHSIVFQNVPISRLRVGPMKCLSKIFKSLKEFAQEICVRDVRNIPVQNISIIQTKGDELIRNENYLIRLFTNEKYHLREWNDGKSIKVYYFDADQCPENFPTDWILPVKKHGLRLYWEKKHEHNFIGQMLRGGNLDQDTINGAQDYLRIYDCNNQDHLIKLKQDLQAEQKPNKCFSFFRNHGNIIQQTT